MLRIKKYFSITKRRINSLSHFIFISRWLQLPLYIGLIIAQCIYVYHFWLELINLIGAAIGNHLALNRILELVTIQGEISISSLNEQSIMLVLLALIDVVMISNLLIMVIIGGYETFVSKMHLEYHNDQPEWLSHVNASVLKVKLATAIIGISSIHLLKTFINADLHDYKTLSAQTVIHLTFLLSAMSIAYCDKLILGDLEEALDESEEILYKEEAIVNNLGEILNNNIKNKYIQNFKIMNSFNNFFNKNNFILYFK